MKHYYFFIILFFTVILSKAQIQNYELGDVVADFTVTDIEGNEHNLYEYTGAGKYVYLDFFFTTCGPCQETAPKLNEFYDKFGCGEGDIMCLSINRGGDNNAEVESYDNTYGGTFNHAPIISSEGNSGTVTTNFNPQFYPTICAINPNNEIINLDIWPVTNAETFETVFPEGFNPEPMECTLIGVDEQKNITSFSLYPNPSDGSSISINLLQSNTAQVSIYDILGKEVFKTNINTLNNKIHPNLKSGNYFIQIETPKSISVRKLIIK